MRLTALFVMPLGIGGAAIVSSLVPLVFGDEFVPAASPAVLFLLASVPAGLAVVPWSYLAAREQGRKLMRITLTSAIIIFATLVAVVPVAGVFGAAVVRIACEIMTLSLLLMAARGHGGPTVPWDALIRTLAAATACGGAAYAVTVLLPGVTGILVAICTGALVYAAAVRLLGLIAADEAGRIADMVEGRLPDGLRRVAQRLIGLIAASPRKATEG